MVSTPKIEGQAMPGLENLPYPSSPWMKYMFKLPLLLWRMGMGPLLGQLFMILTTRGRKSGLARHTPVEYFEFDGRIHAMAAWPKSDWYRNLQADSLVTVQTAAGTQAMRARRVTSDEEWAGMVAYIESNPGRRRIWESMGMDVSGESFLQEKERYHLLTFEPVAKPAGSPPPEPLPVDLWWVWPVLFFAWLYRRAS
jgi:deazaflavin-dependent oxidoreductase (nitroreductase family)